MIWPLAPATIAVVAAITLGVSLLAARRAHKVRVLTQGAALSGNRAALAATQRRARRVWHQHCTYALPTVFIGMALLTTQAIASLALVLPR